jgi:hypothetical protein
MKYTLQVGFKLNKLTKHILKRILVELGGLVFDMNNIYLWLNGKWNKIESNFELELENIDKVSVLLSNTSLIDSLFSQLEEF